MSISVTPQVAEEMTALGGQMEEQTYALWLEIGKRLLVGQRQYGDFTFHTKDLDKEGAEELMDYIVYRAAQARLKGIK